jgi:UDP-GlcNAc:undecaprenyl-phosphate/decaprenyl-phosphate GlcNAc-1-phosphate transferase
MTALLFAGITGALFAGAVASLAFPLVARIAMSVRAVDYPGGRRSHDEAIPRMGGIAIGAGIASGAAISRLLLSPQWFWNITAQQWSAVLAGTALVLIIGAIDDLIGVSPLQRFLVQTVAAISVVFAGLSFDRLYLPIWGEIHLGVWGAFLTVLWIVGVTNAINLLDGLDGLAGGVAAIIATSLLIFAWIQQDAPTVIVMSAILGACLGFLRHNWAPAKIYMGDSGSLTLGFLLAVMSLHSSIKGAATVAILVPILALGLPVIDTLLVMAVRFVEKPQGSLVRRFARMFQADRNHVHHLLARTAPGRKHIVVVIYCVAACFCMMALVVAVSRSAALGVAMVVVEVAVVFLMRNLHVRPKARALSLVQRREVRERLLSAKDEEVAFKYAQRR